MCSRFAAAQSAGEATKDPNLQKIRQIRRLVKAMNIDTSEFQKKMPLAQFIETLTRQTKNQGFAATVDRQAFAKKPDILSAPVTLSGFTEQMNLETAVGMVIRQSGKAIDQAMKPTLTYDVAGIVVTTRAAPRTVYSDAHEIGDLLGSPEIERLFGPREQPDRRENPKLAEKGAAVIHAIISTIDPESWTDGPGHGTLELLNGTRLVVRATAEHHLMLDDFLVSLRRLADVAVLARARMYEVDEAFANKLKNAKQISLEQLEKDFIEGRLPKDDLFAVLAKQEPVLVGNEMKVDKAREVALLSRVRAVVGLAGPTRFREAGKAPRLAFEGFSVFGEFRVSRDRRAVEIRLTEKVAELQEIRKVKVQAKNVVEDETVIEVVQAGPKDETLIDGPFLKESTHERVLEVPDGGSVLHLVHYRPKSLAEKGRLWVSSITVRIRIEAEERMLRQTAKRNSSSIQDGDGVAAVLSPARRRVVEQALTRDLWNLVSLRFPKGCGLGFIDGN
jgi:hypothetical protein